MLYYLKGYQKGITLIKTGRLKQKTNMNTSKKKREEEKVTSTCAISVQIQVHIINNNDKSRINTPQFLYYTGTQFNINFNLFQKDWDAELLEILLGRRFHS